MQDHSTGQPGNDRGLVVKFAGFVVFAVVTPFLALFVPAGRWDWGAGWVYMAILLVVRTALEDRTLQTNLDGYRRYADQVRYRLVPGLW